MSNINKRKLEEVGEVVTSSSKKQFSEELEKKAVIFLESKERSVFGFHAYIINFEEKKIEFLLNKMIKWHSDCNKIIHQRKLFHILDHIEYYNRCNSFAFDVDDKTLRELVLRLVEEDEKIKKIISKDEIDDLIASDCLERLDDFEGKKGLFHQRNRLVELSNFYEDLDLEN